MSTVLERLPADELKLRQHRCLGLFEAMHPDASGILSFSFVNHYYLSGSPAQDGLLWLPREGEPLLMVRKGIDRVRVESSLTRIVPFRSFGDVAGLCAEHEVPLGAIVGVEKGGLSWALGDMLSSKLKGLTLVDASPALTRSRSVKTAFEMERMRETGRRHKEATEEVANLIQAGMTERQIMTAGWGTFVTRGYPGISRSSSMGKEGVYGQVVVGDNGNFPICTDGTIGYVGPHTSIPHFGSDTVWTKKSLLHHDTTFCYQGYYSDKTQMFWSGAASSIPDVVRRAQDVCMDIEVRCSAMLRPDVAPEEIWYAALDIAHKAGYADSFMGLDGNQVKFVGHGIGLEAEGFPVLAPSFTEPLQVGMTLALEPKISIRGMGMVGVENVFEITPEGGKSLSGDNFDIVCIER